MKSKVLMFAGIILIGVAAIVFFSVRGANLNFRSPNHQPASAETAQIGTSIVKYGVPGLLGGLGLIIMIAGLAGNAKNAQKMKMMNHILQTGLDAEGTVTFVDKNFSILINRQPIYSIVEYKFKDNNGKEYVRRFDNVSSEMVIRNKIEVGGKLKIKYLQTDPNQNVMLFS